MKKEITPVTEEKVTKINVGSLIFFLILGILLLIMLFGTIYTIEAGERGVLLTFGKPDLDAKGEGIHFKIPIVQSVKKMDVKTQKYEADLTAASADLQDVNTKIAINYRISAERVPEIYREIGLDYANKVIYPVEQEVNKAITAKFTAVELVTRRDEVRNEMKNLLTERLQPRGINVEEVSIVNFAFSPSFTAAIEAKVTAEQNALAAKNKLEQIKYEADQRVAQAQGEALAIAAQAEAIRAQGGAEYVQLQAISKWDGKLPQYNLGGGAVPFINIQPTA